MTQNSHKPNASASPRVSVRAVGLAAVGVFAVTLGLLLLLGVVIYESRAGETRYETIHMAGERFRVELAITNAQRRRGMAGREHVGRNEGMLFVFDDARVRSFWMKGCLIPLDILFIDPSGRVVQTYTMPAPEPGTPDSELERYSSVYPAQYAVEVKAGTVHRLEIELGDRIDIPTERLKRHADNDDDTDQDQMSAGSGEPHGADTAD